MTPEKAQVNKLLVWSPDGDPRPKWMVQREKDEFSPATEISQGEIYEESVLGDSETSEGGIIRLLKKDFEKNHQ